MKLCMGRGSETQVGENLNNSIDRRPPVAPPTPRGGYF